MMDIRQGVIVAILVHFDVIDGLGEWTQHDVATALQVRLKQMFV